MDSTIAQTLLQQIGRSALFMLGAKDFVLLEKGLRFRIGRNSKGVNRLTITLDPSDTYIVEAEYVRAAKHRVVERCENVYVDSLHSVIEAMTGMRTAMPHVVYGKPG